jgi:2-keto-4-pentenoate hydratase/2-oxohepta-3-ene-1,7-dioic acid hydratase in catechol pathway
MMAAWSSLESLVEALRTKAPDGCHDRNQLTTPMARPGKIYAIGQSDADHCEEVDPHALGIRSFVDDELRHASNIRHLVFKDRRRPS